MRVSVTTVTEAVTDIMRTANPGGIVDQALAARIGGEIRPALEKVLIAKIGSGAELAALSEFRNILHQHLGNPKTAFIESETRRAMQRTLETANRTGSEFSSLVAHAGTRLFPWLAGEASRDGGGESRRGSERVSAAALTRDAPLSVNAAIGFTKELGISPSYAGFFAGGSAGMRDALRGAITQGRAISEENVKSMADVQMVVGAIRAGKMKPDDPRIPDSVKKVIADMQAKGVDPATSDTKLIKKYFKENPNALKDVRKEANADLAARSTASQERIEEESKWVEAKRGVIDAAKPGAKDTKLANPPAAKAHKVSSTL